jgi:hypothetical protein
VGRSWGTVRLESCAMDSASEAGITNLGLSIFALGLRGTRVRESSSWKRGEKRREGGGRERGVRGVIYSGACVVSTALFSNIRNNNKMGNPLLLLSHTFFFFFFFSLLNKKIIKKGTQKLQAKDFFFIIKE